MTHASTALPAVTSVLRFWKLLITLLGAASLVFLVACALLGIQFISQPFLGVFTSPLGMVTGGAPTSTVAWPGLAAGIQRGDVIRSLDGQAFDAGRLFMPQASALLAAAAPGEVMQVGVERSGVPQTFDVPLIRLPDGDILAYFVIPFLSAATVWGFGALLWYYRRDQREGLSLAALAWLTSVLIAGLFETSSTALLTPLWVVGAMTLGGTLLSVALTFPVRLRAVRRTPLLASAPLMIFALLGALVAVITASGERSMDAIYARVTILAVALCLGAAGFITMRFQRAASQTSAARRQCDIVLIGIGLLFIPVALYIPYQFTFVAAGAIPGLPVESFMPLLIFPVAAFTFALLQQQRFDTDRIISHSITHGILLVALIVGTFLLALGGTLIAIDLLNANNLFAITLILFTMVILFTPIRARLQDRIDDLYFRTRRSYTDRVESFSQTLVSSSRYEDISAQYRALLEETLAPASLFVFVRAREAGDYAEISRATEVRFAGDSPLLPMLEASRDALIFPPEEPLPLQLYSEQARLRLLRAHVIAPLKSGDDLIGFVAIAPSRAGRPYTFEELRFFTLLTSQLAVGTERTQVIGSLERRVRELDVLSQVGQAVNFTIEFDDLLELIYAQTSRLVQADCFYIALYNESAQLMNFAFFLEGEERDSAKEAQRWPLDRGLFSEVVRSNTALQTASYVEEMARRGAALRLESPHLRAWMGVPLTAGRRTLGVMAVGKTSHEAFREEQAKIFSDIGALAATSLDKARLFAETRQREQQLTVLNNISRQLVATESDVEKLLQTIMTSAVDILNGEAGSLLLTAEDEPNRLEFRVVIGGAEELLGARIPADKGIAGEVVKTGKAIIVNDAAESKSHQMVTDSYKTQALLAVPLIAKDTVIGVLEVLNKRDGSGFVQEDADLLTTFAGQAAIAIENARLFRMTDLQLAQRVRELEALERIDNELNRTLDVGQVATLTVRAALQTLNAQAGALGIVNEATGRLEIVGIEGYTAAEYPAGAEGLMWSLRTGIISRVMRSRQADLAPDVRIDPSYTPGLTGSLSQMTLPMFSGDTINAILILEKSRMPRFTLSDWAFAQRLAEHASIAIANAQLYDALTQANKSKSEFMGFAAHELKNPLTSVIGFADLLRQGMTGTLTEQQQGLVNIIHSNANRMQSIISDLRDSARMDANEFSVDLAPMQIHHAVRETLRPFAQFMQDKQQQLVNLIRDDLPPILGDEDRLIQVLTNLVSNAHKYSPPGTQITLAAEVVTDYIDQNGRRREPMLRLSVADQGLGISQEDQKRLFRERYFRSTNRQALEQPGTGLGMTLTRGIVEKHNGEIWVESELGKGSTFYVVIPLAPQAVAERS